jgi:hypothetical protein
MMSLLKKLFVLLLFFAGLAGCSTENPDAVFGAHPDDWLCTHSVEDPKTCTSTTCHRDDYNGSVSGSVPSCFSCHLGSDPDFSVHPDSWTTTITDHQAFAIDNSWTTCAVADCHGADLQGGSNPACDTGPSCFTAIGCHTTPDNSPPPPQTHIDSPSYTDARDHGPNAINAFDNGKGQLYCRNCHGRPPNSFNGGMVSDPAILNLAGGNCSSAACHLTARAHPTNWQGTNDTGLTDQDPTWPSTHRAIDQTTGIVANSCALCHKTTAVGAGPMPGAPSCYSTGFTNANGSATNCHTNGPGAAPHATDGSYQDPVNHGLDAKTNLGLDFCKDCHARLVTGNNYRFDVPVGQLLNGCEDCHKTDAAHPPAELVFSSQDRWTFYSDPAVSDRRTHFAAAAPLTNCTLCHGTNLTGGSGPSCYTCHDPAVAAPVFRLQCTFCHGSPPDGSVDLTGSQTPVNHSLPGGNVSAIADHDDCATCHGAKDDGSGQLAQRNGNYLLFDRTNAPQGGDHLDGNIEMNGPTASNTGAAYNFADQGCDLACHSNVPQYQMDRNSGLDIVYGDYSGGSGVSGCTSCHAYPPDGNADLTTATPVSHLFNDNGVKLLANHNDCQLCHGTRNDGFDGHDPSINYNPANDHNTNPHQINMNINFGYVSTAGPSFGGCNSACHLNDVNHRFPNSSDLTIVEGDYGSAICASCHDDVTSGAPIVRFGDPHAGTICESCHPGGNRGVVHGDDGDAGVVLIPNNTTVGIDYTSNGETGIYLGGNDTIGTTEAQICWNCHDDINKSEWGTNTGTGSSYDYGDLYTTLTGTTKTSDWTNAFWRSGNGRIDTDQFYYKRGAIQSTHAADAAGLSGVDAVGDIRCSYCHDVHDLNLLTSDNESGAPYLRGTWMGNPYREDGAPQSGDLWTTSIFGAVPRGTIASTELGGYQIDQNNDDPTSGWTADNSSSLCELCHGSGDGTWDVGTTDGNGDNEIDRINEFGTASTDWVGTNGHSNATIGGTGNNEANIFSMADRNATIPTTGSGNGYLAGNPAMAYSQQTASGAEEYGFRPNNGDSDEGWIYAPMAPRTSSRRAFPASSGAYNWGATVFPDNSIDTGYHNFSCSKCHNPHASRLPRLMITNCLDTKHNTWDDDFGTPSGTSQSGDAINATNANVTVSQFTSAQNCHRVNDPNFLQSRGAGWNNVTPW